MAKFGVTKAYRYYADRFYLDRANRDTYIYRDSAGNVGLSGIKVLSLAGGAGSYITAPVLTTTQRNALTAVEGMVIFNSTTDQLEEYDGSTWEAVGQVILDTHTLDADAHHPQEIPSGRGKFGTTTLLSLPGITSNWTSSTEAYITGRIYHFPLYVRTPITIDQVTYEVTIAAAAGNKLRFAIHDADTDWQPVAQKVASAELAIDSVAVVNGALTETIYEEGRYLAMICVQANATLRSLRYGSSYIGFNPSFGTTPNVYQIRRDVAYGALPDPGVAWDSVSYASEPLYYTFLLRVKTP